MMLFIELLHRNGPGLFYGQTELLQRPILQLYNHCPFVNKLSKWYHNIFLQQLADKRFFTSKGSPYSITERRVPELIPVLGSQPAGDVSHKSGGRLPLLSARPAVTPARGQLPISLLGEQRHHGCEQFA